MALLVLILPAAVQAQRTGSAACPPNIIATGGTINASSMSIAYGDTKVYPDWFTRSTLATSRNAVTVTLDAFGLNLVNYPYLKDRNLINAFGTATSATYLLGLVDSAGSLVHGFTILLGSNTQKTVPAQTSTFHSLQPGTRYAVTVFADDVKGETEPLRLPVVAKRPIIRNCVETAS